jgi:transposase
MPRRGANFCGLLHDFDRLPWSTPAQYALYQAAMIASSKHRFFMAYFASMLQGREREQGIRTKMRVRLAAKMLVIAWTLMKKGEPFNPEYLNMQ